MQNTEFDTYCQSTQTPPITRRPGIVIIDFAVASLPVKELSRTDPGSPNQPLYRQFSLCGPFANANDKDFTSIRYDYYETHEKGHGREETRRLWCSDQIEGIEEAGQWRGLRTLIMLESSRTVGTTQSLEYRYYIASGEPDAKSLLASVRAHWGIENSVHWVLDMAFREDESRVRDRVAAEYLSLLRKIALNMLKQDKSTKLGIKNKRLRAGWDEPYLLHLLRSCEI